ncbi:oxygen-insensitive NAD(P)H nitroreductase [Burkholderiaceae bacterium DAT-1]|nr:oxygen-insensitive NAD(P)H nitroreductase [Burkholderiaceae bacterium DAT-1]
MNIAELVTTRRTTKAFDPARKIAPETFAQIETLLRYSPSSTNSQPWHFVIASDEAGKALIAKACGDTFAFNDAKVRNASHVIAFCTRATIDESYLATLLDQETTDGRLGDDTARANQHKGRARFVNMHRFERRDAQHWMEKQTYLALGTLLLGAAALGVDACPIEGFDNVTLDDVLGLRDKGYTSSVLVALGYSSADDFNAKLPKSRLPAETIFTRL